MYEFFAGDYDVAVIGAGVAGLVAVDGALRTSAANVYAIGDLVAGRL